MLTCSDAQVQSRDRRHECGRWGSRCQRYHERRRVCVINSIPRHDQNRGIDNDVNELLTATTPAGRKAVSIKCDVTQWDEQVALFELAIARFGSVDIVVGGTSCALNVRLQFKKYPYRSQMQVSTKAKRSAGAISSLSMASPRGRSY